MVCREPSYRKISLDAVSLELQSVCENGAKVVITSTSPPFPPCGCCLHHIFSQRNIAGLLTSFSVGSYVHTEQITGIYPPQRQQKKQQQLNIACEKKIVYTVDLSWNNCWIVVFFSLQLQQFNFIEARCCAVYNQDFPHNNTLETCGCQRSNKGDISERPTVWSLWTDKTFVGLLGSITKNNNFNSVNISGCELMNMHTLTHSILTFSPLPLITPHTHLSILCQMFRSEEFLQLWNVSLSGKYNEQSKQRSIQVWVESKEI